MAGMTDMALRETRFIDSGHPDVTAFAAPHLRPGDDVATAVNLYYAIRDAVPYDIRAFGLDEDDFVDADGAPGSLTQASSLHFDDD